MHRELSNHCILTQIEGFAVIIFNKGFVYGGFCSLIACYAYSILGEKKKPCQKRALHYLIRHYEKSKLHADTHYNLDR